MCGDFEGERVYYSKIKDRRGTISELRSQGVPLNFSFLDTRLAEAALLERFPGSGAVLAVGDGEISEPSDGDSVPDDSDAVMRGEDHGNGDTDR